MKKDAVFYHIHRFSSKNRLYGPESKILLGLSAGADSMFLLNFFLYAKMRCWIQDLRAIYINHNQRLKEARNEEEFLHDYCKKHEVEFTILGVERNIEQNIEYLLRKERRSLLMGALKEGESLALAHHLSDSFEWSLRQSFRSSDLFAGLGIPVKNGRIIRPLLSLSKKQIMYFKSVYQIPHLEDSSNFQQKFERNYLRLQVINNIERRFPNYLKHYVRRQESLLALYQQIKFQKKKQKIKVGENSEFINFGTNDSSLSKKDQLLCALKKWSRVERGTWSEQIEKFLKLVDSPHPKGPMSMSGGLFLYSLGNNRALLSTKILPFSLKELKDKYNNA